MSEEAASIIVTFGDIQVSAYRHGRRPLLVITRNGELVDRLRLDPDDLREREKAAEMLEARSPGGRWLTVLRDTAQALAESYKPLDNSVSSQGVGVSAAPAGRPSLLVKVPRFFLWVLPEGVHRYVEEVSQGMDCPPDLVAVPLLAAAGAVWGNKLTLRLTAQRVERAVVWAAVVAEPGSAKSPAMEAALAPLLTLQKEAYQDWREAMEAWEREVEAARKDKKAPPPRPVLEHFFTSDVTLEAIARILGESPTPGLAVVMDELAAWVRSFDSYHVRGERQRWLSLWAGVPVKVDRATKGTFFIERPVVCVVGGITPRCLPLLEAEASQEDGFIDRVLYSYPDTSPMRFVDATPPTVDLAPAFRRLRDCPEGEVALSGEAKEAYAAYVDSIAERQEKEGFWPLRRYMSKMPRHVARLALVLHALRHPHDPAALPLPAETMRQAIALGDYFLVHAHRVLLEFGEGALARRVLELLTEAGPMELTALYGALGGHVRARELREVRDFLVGRGLLEVTSLLPSSVGGRPAERWALRSQHGDPHPCEETEITKGLYNSATCGESAGEMEEVL